MDTFYDQYLASSSVLLDEWFRTLKVLFWDFVLLLLFLIFCFIIYKIVIVVLSKFLKLTRIAKLNEFYEKMEIFNKFRFTINFQAFILNIIKVVLILIFVVVGADLFNFPGVTQVVNDLIAYLPKLISAIAIILIGFYITNRIKEWLNKMLILLGNNSGAKIISNFVVGGFLLFFILMGLNQAGIDTTLITNNISIILGVVFASIALSFGLGSKDIVKEILYGYYIRKSVKVGDRIRLDVDNVEGVLLSVDNINVKIATDDGVVIYPIKKFVTLKIEILK